MSKIKSIIIVTPVRKTKLSAIMTVTLKGQTDAHVDVTTNKPKTIFTSFCPYAERIRSQTCFSVKFRSVKLVHTGLRHKGKSIFKINLVRNIKLVMFTAAGQQLIPKIGAAN